MSTVENARALMRLFAASPWRDLHVRSEAGEFFLAKADGSANPMKAQVPGSTLVSLAAEPILVRAPHVATLVCVAGDGTPIVTGETIATIELLGTRFELPSPATGRVVADEQPAVGALLEYDTVLAGVVAA